MLNPLYGWSAQETPHATAIFPERHLPILEEAGLAHLVTRPDQAVDNKPDFEKLSQGGKSAVYSVNGTDILVKKHFPEFWFEGEFKNRAVTRRAVLANLAANVALERALDGDQNYVTPRYLGHLMLGGRNARHYTLMTRLHPGRYPHPGDPDWERYLALTIELPRYCSRALLRRGRNPMLINWSEVDENTFPIKQDGEQLKVGIIDAESRLSRYPRLLLSKTIEYWQDEDPLIGNI